MSVLLFLIFGSLITFCCSQTPVPDNLDLSNCAELQPVCVGSDLLIECPGQNVINTVFSGVRCKTYFENKNQSYVCIPGITKFPEVCQIAPSCSKQGFFPYKYPATPNIRKCNSFYTCTATADNTQLQAKVYTCSGGQNYDVILEQCLPSAKVDCSLLEKNVNVCTEGTVKQDPMWCDMFQVCRNNEWIPTLCPEVTPYYDTNYNQCLNDISICGNRIISAKTTLTDTTTSPIILTTPTLPEVNCTAPGLKFADPTSCKNYYECSPDLQPILKTCPLNLGFNSNSLILTCTRCLFVNCPIACSGRPYI